jgi:ribosomal protein S2
MVDVEYENTAVVKATLVGIDRVALVDTNSDMTIVEYSILSNDDSMQSIHLILRNRLGRVITKNELVQIEPDATIGGDIEMASVGDPEEGKPAAKPKHNNAVKNL